MLSGWSRELKSNSRDRSLSWRGCVMRGNQLAACRLGTFSVHWTRHEVNPVRRSSVVGPLKTVADGASALPLSEYIGRFMGDSAG
jgi:hypothetical protein